jgi:SAM-dependent methyltransferase
VVCGHAQATVVSTADDLKAEVELLWAYHGRRLRATVPPPHLVDRVAFSQPTALAVVQCDGCGLVYRNPVERATTLTEIYARADLDDDALRALHESQLPAYRSQVRRLIEVLGRRGSVLEIGSYAGGFLAAASEMGLAASGVDVNATANAFTRRLGFTVHDGEIADVSDGELDAIAIWNTFDQLADTRAVLREVRSRLRPGGILAVRVPNGGVYAQFAPRARGTGATAALARALLAQNNLLSFPYRTGFTPSALSRLVAECGFATRTIVGDVLVPIADRWTRPWARIEERLFKRATRIVARSPDRAPWFELYAERRE